MSVLSSVIEQSTPILTGDTGGFTAGLSLKSLENGRAVYTFQLATDTPAVPPQLSIKWTLPATNIKGVWTSGALYEKRLRADWEPVDMVSRLSVNAPVISLFGHQDENRLTFAWSDAINTVKLAAPVREEDNLIHCRLELFPDGAEPMTEYSAELLLDYASATYDLALAKAGHWWEAHIGATNLFPVPGFALDPIYSTWYSYHQELSPEALLEECRLAKDLGYSTIIVDDGWQTLDNQRGYDYTGDWLPERLTDLGHFVHQVKSLGMRAMIWYSVPFCGPKSQAYQRFTGKFLTENHRWAPVFDPRYPEVRSYLVDKYRQAIIDWELDGLKLDFIDDFRVYPETPAGKADGRDFADVNAAVAKLVLDIRNALLDIRSDLLIEFRQKYIGPELRRAGNLFRAFDCPNDSATNRLRTTDVRLIGGSSITTSDMITWHAEESVEVAALQLNNILFSVPQISVRLAEQSPEKLDMIRFWTGYYNANRELLMSGCFRANAPLENYPMLSVSNNERMIIGLYGNSLINIPENIREVDIINGKMTTTISLRLHAATIQAQATILDCQGIIQEQKKVLFGEYHLLEVPPSGLLRISRR